MQETYIKRTIWVWECCDPEAREVRTENPPREKLCNKCGQWSPFVEQSAISAEYKAHETG